MHLNLRAFLCQFSGEGFGKHDYAVFAYLIDAFARAADYSQNRGSVDDMTFSLLREHARHERTDTVNYAP